jgi:hypothetical protein
LGDSLAFRKIALAFAAVAFTSVVAGMPLGAKERQRSPLPTNLSELESGQANFRQTSKIEIAAPMIAEA